MIAANIIVSGLVQGVGYRAFVLDKAKKMGEITGWVRNLPNGNKVEVFAEGTSEDIDSLIEKLKQGPSLSKIKEVSIERTEIKIRKYDDFSIR
ncbi:acylphosphatase [Candidatus Poribacteria bacterium]|nr:acylphosphatase [Candidatus Poribacteria bacterium]